MSSKLCSESHNITSVGRLFKITDMKQCRHGAVLNSICFIIDDWFDVFN